jgi:hypothetical protein
VDLHPVGIIIRSLEPPRGIRFEIDRCHWEEERGYDQLPARVIGAIDKWNRKETGSLLIDWETDGSNSMEWLSALLKPELEIKLLPYADNGSAPKAKGSAAKRAYAVAISTGPYASGVPAPDLAQVQINYREGGNTLVQIWDVRGPTFVKEDWRSGERFRASINLLPSKYNTLEKMLFNVALFTPFAKQMASWSNERLEENGTSDWERRTTEGEWLKFWGYLVMLSLYPCVPINEMWRVKQQPGDLFSPPAVGRHGLTKNRFKKMRELAAMMFSKDEDELNETDPWRYCRAPVEAYNDRRRRLIVPSW